MFESSDMLKNCQTKISPSTPAFTATGITYYGPCMYPRPARDETCSKILLRMPCAHIYTAVRMPCTPLQKYTTRMSFFQVLCFPLQKSSKNPIVASEPSFMRRFRELQYWAHPKGRYKSNFANFFTIFPKKIPNNQKHCDFETFKHAP